MPKVLRRLRLSAPGVAPAVPAAKLRPRKRALAPRPVPGSRAWAAPVPPLRLARDAADVFRRRSRPARRRFCASVAARSAWLRRVEHFFASLRDARAYLRAGCPEGLRHCDAAFGFGQRGPRPSLQRPRPEARLFGYRPPSLDSWALLSESRPRREPRPRRPRSPGHGRPPLRPRWRRLTPRGWSGRRFDLRPW